MGIDGALDERFSTSIYIDGFRSLRNFHVKLRPGLNVLVGPNGSGKTNFIDFLGFLEEIARSSATAGVSRLGGISKVFSQEIIRTTTPSVYTRICGVAEIPEQKVGTPGQKFFRYEYELEIRFRRSEPVLFISREKIKFRTLFGPDDDMVADRAVGSMSVVRKSANPDAPQEWEFGPRLAAQNGRNPMNVPVRQSYRLTPIQTLERFQGLDLAPDESILSARSMSAALDAIRLAITRGKSFNIVPDKAREPDDLTRPTIIGRDGTGLSSTLYRLTKAKNRAKPTSSFDVRYKHGLETVVEWTKLVFPNLQDIEVVQDPHTGKFLGYLIVGEEKGLRLPLQSVSDGTLKWLCLVCLLVTSAHAYSIEEPENYLHPKMQQFLVALLRDTYDFEEPSSGYSIVSTHSETMINQFSPMELVLFEFVDGATRCKRISNPETVMDEINRTGFGLGYYYANNTLT